MYRSEEAFRRLSIGDPGVIATLDDPSSPASPLRRLDDRTATLLRIAVLVALDAPQSAYVSAVGAAERAGANIDDVLAVLAAVASAVGSARVISAAPRLALAAGYDVEAALEG